MATALHKKVVERLLLCKSLLARLRFHSAAEPDRYLLASQILTAHDASELAAAAVADQRDKLPPRVNSGLLEYLNRLKELHPGEPVPRQEFFSRLNHVRNGVKHNGEFPDSKDWARVGEDAFDYVSQLCAKYLEISLDDLDESALLASAEVKKYFDSAKQALAEQKYEEVLVHLGKGLHTVFKENSALRGLEVGVAKSEDAIRLTDFGVHANAFLTLQEFLPKIVEEREGVPSHKWELSQFGHPANWREESAQFCLETFLDVALKLQDARWIPGALPFDLAYHHKITALKDGVKIESERRYLAGLDALPIETLLGKRTRGTSRTLSKGESMFGKIISRDLIPQKQDSVALENSEETYEIRFSSGGFEMLGVLLFVAEKDVKITCVPTEFIKQYLPDLSEIDWEPA